MMRIVLLSCVLFSRSTTGFVPRTTRSRGEFPPSQTRDEADAYGPEVTSGCVRNVENHLRLLDQSLATSRGAGVFEWIRTRAPPGAAPATAVRLDADARFGVLSHGTQPDPVFNYGNAASLALFEQDIKGLCRTPSRYSTVPELMEDRSRLIRDIETQGYGYIDDAVRVSARGRLFRIRRILVWTVFDDMGHRIGLAAVYDRNEVTPYEDDNLHS